MSNKTIIQALLNPNIEVQNVRECREFVIEFKVIVNKQTFDKIMENVENNIITLRIENE